MKILSLALASVTCACATPNAVSLADLDAIRARNVSVASRVYEGRKLGDVRAAAFEVLKLVNPTDMRFDVRSDRLLASQTWSINLILSAQYGQRWYEVVFEQTDKGTRATLGLDEEAVITALIVPMQTTSFREGIPVSSSDDYWFNATLFFARLDYMLGLAPQWPTCPDFEKKYGKTPMHFCGGFYGGIGVADKTPSSPGPIGGQSDH